MSKAELQLKLDELAVELGLERAPDWMPWQRGIKLTFDHILPPAVLSAIAPRIFVNMGMMHHKQENGVSTLIIFDFPLS